KNVRRSKVAFSSVILDLVGLTVVVPLSPALFDCYSKHDSSGLYSSVLSCVTCYQHIIGVPARFHSVLFGGMWGLMMMIPAFILIGANETNLGLYSGLTLYAIVP
ncbi:hypothetical protein O3P69_013467, partial [Scylla paramamosain]